MGLPSWVLQKAKKIVKRAMVQQSACKSCLLWILSFQFLTGRHWTAQLPLRTFVGQSALEAFYIIATLHVCGPSSLHYITGSYTKSNMLHCTLKLTLRETNTCKSLSKCPACLNFSLIQQNYYCVQCSCLVLTRLL